MKIKSKLKKLLEITGCTSVTEACVGFRIESSNNALTIKALIAGGWKAKEVNGYVVARA